MVLGVLPVGVFAADGGLSFFGNEFEISSPDDWATGDLDEGKLAIDDTVGDGAIKLADGETEATYTSAEISMDPGKSFEYMVMSWNADAPEGTWVEVTASVWLDKYQEWSNYVTWGKWSPFIQRASHASYSTADSPHINIDWDELTVRGDPDDGDTASKVKLQVILHRDSTAIASPVLWYLHGTTRTTGVDPEKVFRDGLGVIDDYTCEVEVPRYSQMIRSPNIGGIICNATTTTMLLNSVSQMEGNCLNLLPEEVSMGCYDFRANSFGNWAFAMAAAGSYGYQSYVDYSTIEGIKRHLKSGCAVGASVAYSTDPTAYNYLENAYGSTGGHLIVLRGFTVVDGVEYFISNDAFNPTNNEVRKLYKVEQFENVWSRNTIYIVKPGKVTDVGKCPVERVHADLEEVEPYKYALKLDVFGAATPITTPKKNSTYSDRHGFIGYITEPEVFIGDDPSVYSYINVATNESDLLTLPDSVLEDEDLRLYVANNDAHTGKMFIVDKDSNIKYLVSTTITSTDYMVSDDQISPNEKAIVFGETEVDQFLEGLHVRPDATMKLFAAGTVVDDAAAFSSTEAKTAGTLAAGDFIAVLGSDNTTMQKYSIAAGVALKPLNLYFEQDSVGLYHYQFPFTNTLHGYEGNGKITYTSSNTGVAVVDDSGVVTPWNVGTDVVITADVASDGIYQAATASYKLSVLRGTISGFHWGTIVHPRIGQEPSKVYTPSPEDDYDLFFFATNEPLFTWNGSLEDGKFKEGETYSVSIRLQSNDYPGTNSAYFYANPFTADMITGLPSVGDKAGDATITGVTVTRNNNYRLTVKIDYSPLQPPEEPYFPPIATPVISAYTTWGDGGVRTLITDDQVTSALGAALGTGGSGDVAKVTVQVNAPQGQGAIDVAMSGAALSMLARETRAALTVTTPVASFTLGRQALGALAALVDDTDQVVFRTETVDLEVDDLSDEARDILGDAAVWRIAVSIGGAGALPIPGATEVFIPHALLPDEEADALTLLTLDGSKGLAILEDVRYDAGKRGLLGTADSSSRFCIVKKVAKLVTDYGDVRKADWYYPGVKFVTETGLMNGIAEDAFAPYGDMSRAMLVATLYRYAGSPEVTTGSAFTDVADGQWYTDAVAWAEETDIVQGYGNGLFGTHDQVTRQEFATILHRFAVKQGAGAFGAVDLSGYADSEAVAGWAEAAMKWAVAEGIIEGRSGTQLVPGASSNRAEAATILMRYAGLGE